MTILIWSFIFSFLTSASVELEFLGDFTAPQHSMFEKTLIGGLSGIYLKNNLVWAVSDDRGQNNEPRIYSFRFNNNLLENSKQLKSLPVSQKLDNPTNFSMIPTTVLKLKEKPQAVGRRLQIDAEALVPFEDGWLISSEGNYNSSPRKAPSLIYFNNQGVLIREISWPDNYSPNPTGRQKKGLRSNYAFEGLSLSPDQKYLYAIHEAPLLQEDSAWRGGDSGDVHLLRFKIYSNSSKIDIDKDIIYNIDNFKKTGEKILGSGVSEILALTDDKVLILERAVLFSSVDFLHYEARIYEVSLDKPLSKKLVLDLAKIKSLLKTTKELDNFEGMALGPNIDNQASLILVSDDNFTPIEKTIWLLFKLNLEH